MRQGEIPEMRNAARRAAWLAAGGANARMQCGRGNDGDCQAAAGSRRATMKQSRPGNGRH